MVKAFTPWGVEVNFYTLWCNGQHCKEYPQHSTIVGSTFPILYIPMHFSICVFVFSDMTPQNIIVDIPVLSYYPKDSMCLEI